MVVSLVAKLAVAAVAAAGLSVPAVAVATPSASAAPPGPCAAGPYETSPAQSCTDMKNECLSGSVQEGTYGERYVPTEAVAMCMQAYRDCVNANSDDDTDAVG